MLALDSLRLPFARTVALRFQLPRIRPPMVGVKAALSTCLDRYLYKSKREEMSLIVFFRQLRQNGIVKVTMC